VTDRVEGDEIRLVEWFLETVINSIIGALFYTVLDFHAKMNTGKGFAELILEEPRRVHDALFMALNRDEYALEMIERVMERHIQKVLKRPINLFEVIRDNDVQKVRQIILSLAREYIARTERR